MRFILLFLLSFNLYAAGHFEVKSHREILQYLEKNDLLNNKTLIVFDIDNTLLKSKHLFGSDQWFNWQLEEIKNQSPYALAQNLDELIELQTQIFLLGKMQLTENYLPELIQSWTKKGVSIFALTSRGPEMSVATLRELKNNNLHFNTKIGYDLDPAFTPIEAGNKALYKDGVFMTSGMHKGKMLDYLLQKFDAKFNHIIFIDDHLKHTTRVYETLHASGLDISSFRYGHEDTRVQAFHQSDKSKTIRLGEKFKEIINELN